MKILKHVPNGITCLNLLCGFYGLILAFQGDLKNAGILIFLALLFDFFDGFVARLFKANSIIGKELDSLADMISFGVLPGIIIFKLACIDYAKLPYEVNVNFVPWFAYLAGIVPVLSALRLAKFNVDTRQAESFIGLPTPANAMVIGALPFIYLENTFANFRNEIIQISPIAIGIVMSILLVTEVQLIALKFKNYTWRQNSSKYILILFSIFFVLVYKIYGIPLIIISYFLFSLIENKRVKTKS